MADEGTVSTDVMATPEQVLAAGGVSKRRRGASSSKRRSPSGQRRRAPTPEPPKDLPMDPDEKLEASPTKTGTVKRISTIEKTITTKRSQSSPGEGRQSLSSFTPDEMKQEMVLKSTEPAEQIEQRTDLSPTKTVVTKRKSTAEKTLMTKRSQSSPGEGRHSLPLSSTNGDMKQEATDIAVPHRKRPLSSDGVEKNDETASSGTVKKSLSGVVQKSSEKAVNNAEESAKAKTPVEAKIFEDNSQVKRHEVIQKSAKAKTPLDSFQTKTPEDDLSGSMTKEEEVKQVAPAGSSSVPTTEKPIRAAVWRPFFREMRHEWKTFVNEHGDQWGKIVAQRNRCIGAMVVMFIYCGLGGLVFRFTEGAFEVFYKCGVKRVKRDFVDSLWLGSHHLLEDEWKSQARRKLMELETQLHAAHEAGVTSYSGQRAWSFLNAVVYCLTVVTTIGYGHISPSTTTGRAITIVYAIFGIPMFLILLADFGKLFTRMIKFVWAFVRRVYYTGSCKKVRRTVPVQEVMKGVQLVYDFATFRRPSQMMGEPGGNGKAAPIARPEDLELQVPLNPPPPPPQQQPTMNMPIDGHEPPGTPALSTYEVDDEFNLPISVAIFILVIYIFVGAIIYWTWENWGFFESFYFVFISMSTIGFGDFVPQHPMYMMASIVYLVFGLALTSMCINVVQEKLSDSFRQASAKIGATIGLRVTEEDGTLTPVPPVQVELPEVHNTVIKSQST